MTVVTPGGVVMDRERIKTIVEWPEPRGFHDIQVFVGFANFYRRFIFMYSEICRPLNDLVRNAQRESTAGKKRKTKADYKFHNVNFVWTDSASQAFRDLKAAFTEAPVLIHFDPALPIMIITDASDYAYGGILLQPEADDDSKPDDVQWHPVAYHSKSFVDAEIRYDTHDKELHAIDSCFKVWRHYVEGATHAIRVLTDHNNLRWFMTTKVLSARQARYAERLAAYDFEIEHKAGTSNPADALSRRPDYALGFKDGTKRELLSGMLPTLQSKLQMRNSPLKGIGTADSKHGNACEPQAIPASNADWTDHPSQPTETVVASLTRYSKSEEAWDGRTTGEVQPQMGQVLSALCHVLRSEVVAATTGESAHEAGPREDLLEYIKRIQEEDPFVTDLRAKALDANNNKGRKKVTLGTDGLLRRSGKVYIPRCIPLRQELLRRNHDDPAAGHYGARRTREVIQRKYFWPELGQDVQTYIGECNSCQRNKSHRHKPYGQLAPIPSPTEAWRHYSLDFITDLPGSSHANRTFDAILVLVDRLTKLSRYLPVNKTMTAPAMAELLWTEVFSKSGPPDSLISDRGSVFTSEYWSAICYHLRVKRRMSTAFHPQTDGQTERQNQELEVYLRMYVSYEQDDWAAMLPTAEFAYNSKKHSTTGLIPIEVAYGVIPRMPDGLRDEGLEEGGQTVPEMTEPAAEERLKRMRFAREQAAQAIEKAQQAQAEYYNRSRQDVHFNVGEKVLLHGKNIRTKRPHKKLDRKYLGPFTIEEQVGRQAYRLTLPPPMARLHPVFNVSLLEKYKAREGFEPPAVDELEDPGVFEVEDILSHREQLGKELEYLVKWVGWSLDHNQWLPESELENCQELLQSYRQRQTMRVLPAKESRAKRVRVASDIRATEPKRGRGRPRGSRNKN